MTRRGTTIVLLALLATLLPVAAGPSASALTDRWSQWAPITGESRDYATTMRQQSPGFPEAAVASDSRGNVQLAGGVSTFLGVTTPPGQKYGSSQGSPYLVLRPRADNAAAPSTTTYTFDDPTPDTGWAFVLGDVDSDQVVVRATDETGDEVPAAEIDSWFRGSFNYAGDTDLPTWDPTTSALVGNPGAADTEGASGWFEPDVRLSSLTLVFTRRAGFPVYQTWFVSRARPVGGTLTDVSTTGSCPLEDSALTLVSPYGDELATTSPAADGSYSFGEVATQGGYVVRLTPPAACAVVGPAQATVSNRGDDGDPASRADFDVRVVIPQLISGTVSDGDGDPVAGVELTLTRPDDSTVTITTGPDGTYLFDDNPVGTGYTVTVTVPAGYRAGPGGTTRTGIEVDAVPITDQDFVLIALAAVSGTVTGGGEVLGGVQVTVTPTGAGPAITTVTAGDGTYSLDGVPPGDYTLSIAAPPGFDGDTSRPLTVGSDDVVDEDFALARLGAVAGTVTDEESGSAVPDVEISVDGPGPAEVVTTDGDGVFFVDDLAAGAYLITIAPPLDTEVVGSDTREATITDAGELVDGRDFVLTDADGPTEPTSGPTTQPTPEPTPEPTSGPTSSPGTDGPTTEPGGPTDAGGDLPDTGGPPLALVALGLLLLVVGVVLTAASVRGRPRG